MQPPKSYVNDIQKVDTTWRWYLEVEFLVFERLD